MNAGAHFNFPAPGAVRRCQRVFVLRRYNQPAGGEIRAFHEAHQIINLHVIQLIPVLQHELERRANFTQIVGRNGGGHSYGDASASVNQQVGECGRKHGGFLQCVVEIRREIDCVFLDVGEQLRRNRVQARFGVTHCRWCVAIHRAEVPLPIDQFGAHGEILGHARHRVVHGLIAMRVILAQHLADDTRGFFVGRARADTHVVHGIENAAMHRFQAIACIRQRARHNHAHGVR